MLRSAAPKNAAKLAARMRNKYRISFFDGFNNRRKKRRKEEEEEAASPYTP